MDFQQWPWEATIESFRHNGALGKSLRSTDYHFFPKNKLSNVS